MRVRASCERSPFTTPPLLPLCVWCIIVDVLRFATKWNDAQPRVRRRRKKNTHTRSATMSMFWRCAGAAMFLVVISRAQEETTPATPGDEPSNSTNQLFFRTLCPQRIVYLRRGEKVRACNATDAAPPHQLRFWQPVRALRKIICDFDAAE